ncbi:MAG: DUF1320 family protein [Ignavibacteriae bacterium]|nr:DUF1320 family protein [Ignavibacteriota bacterium]
MAYASRTRIIETLIPAGDMSLLLDDEVADNNTVTSARFDAICQAVDNELNAMLRGLYAVPFSEVPDLLGRIADAKVAYMMYGRRPTPKPDNITDANAWAEKRLADVLARRVQLTETASSPVRTPPPVASKKDTDRIFTQDMLDSMP